MDQNPAARSSSRHGDKPDPTRAQEALRLIVEVFRDGNHAAAALRRRSGALTAGEVRTELDAIERGMLTRIARICVYSEVVETLPVPGAFAPLLARDGIPDALGEAAAAEILSAVARAEGLAPPILN